MMQPETKDSSLMDQYHRPTGPQGRVVAAKMNQDHAALTTWGLKHVEVKPDFIVLDVGCGGGKTISRLAKKASQGKVFGIDHSATMVEYSREANKKLIEQGRVEVVEGSVEKTAFKDEFFDLVTAVETYYFWPDLPKAFQEIRRILKAGGYLLIVSEMVKDGIYEVENAELIAKTHVRLLSLHEIQKMLQSTGFVNIKVFTNPKSYWNAVLAQK